MGTVQESELTVDIITFCNPIRGKIEGTARSDHMYSKIAGIMFPAFTMLTLTVLSVFGLFGEGDVNKSFFILGLTIIFPLTFLVQGISSALNKINPFIALFVSYIAFAVILMAFLDQSYWRFTIYYLVFWLMGYVGIKAFQKWRNHKNK